MGKKSLQTFNLPENIIMMSKEDFMMNYMTYNEEEDEYYFKKLDGKDLVYICQGSVGGDWVKEQLENKEKTPTHVLLSYDTSVRGRKQSIRGISMIKIEKRKKNIKVILLCNASASKITTRNKTIKPSGKDLMTTVIEVGKHLKYKTVSLDAINDVVSYYSKVYGFDWIKKNQRGTDRKEEIKQLAKLTKRRMADKEDVRDEDIGRRYGALGLKKGFYKEEDLRESLPYQDELDEDEVLDTVGAKKDLWLALGAPMVLDIKEKKKKKNKKTKKEKKKNKNKTARKTKNKSKN